MIFTLWAGHIEYNAAGRSAYRGEGPSIDKLKKVFEEAILGWLPHAQAMPNHAWGEIRAGDGVSIITKAYWDGLKWGWTQ